MIGWAMAVGLSIENKDSSGDNKLGLPPYRARALSHFLAPEPFKGDLSVGSFQIFGAEGMLDSSSACTCRFLPSRQDVLGYCVSREVVTKLNGKKLLLKNSAEEKRQASEW